MYGNYFINEIRSYKYTAMTEDSDNLLGEHSSAGNKERDVFSKLKNLVFSRSRITLRETLEEYIEELDKHAAGTVSDQERNLISNVLKLRDLTAVDVMIPRADIVSIELGTSQHELMSLLSEKQFSRLPVYRD